MGHNLLALAGLKKQNKKRAPAGATGINDHCKRVSRPLTRAGVLSTAASPRLSPAHGGSKETVGHNLSAVAGLSIRRRSVLDFDMTGPAGKRTVRSVWMVRRNENFPRFVTCYVL